MVAYSFKQRFVAPIRAGTKRQTIRADRKRHAYPGEQLQLYTGMRTRECKLIGRAFCFCVLPIVLIFDDDPSHEEGFIVQGGGMFASIDAFAIADGFASWADLKAFWRENHPGIDEFQGNLIKWGDLDA
ncbi:hypothetical protein [Mesorhizobium sp.]|uniref:hypothetical protein n=1 Tax=Mesorhizobium sp. TaxID=1871066 RepID=UPI0011F62321|nr:hypothetical protein [Mesorhizobium sp.]TIP13173.1 MAG: hypothetical protein E5X73_10100 [Mesorhizobium sp.]